MGKDGKRWEKMGKDDHPHDISMKFPRFRWPRRFCLGVSCADIFAQWLELCSTLEPYTDHHRGGPGRGWLERLMETKTDSETICDSETISTDSETITIQKLYITIQKLARFRNYHDSETFTIQKLSRFRNYRASETTIKKTGFKN